MHSSFRSLGFLALFITFALAQTPPPVAHFHHIHLNVTDPQAAIDFYTKHFDCEKAKFAGTVDAVWAQKSWILFTKVNSAPPSEILSTIWHMGWGAEDVPKEYQRQLDLGAKFETPVTDISDIGMCSPETGKCGGDRRGLFFYSYVRSPDGALIELNTATHHRFGHLHLFSDDPVAAGEWYAKHFGIANVRYQKAQRIYRDIPIGPSASFPLDNVNVIIYPAAYPRAAWPQLWKPGQTFVSTKGRAIDHIGLSVDDLDATLERLKSEGVTVTDPPRSVLNGKVKFAFIEGPDKMRIEVVEGQAKKE